MQNQSSMGLAGEQREVCKWQGRSRAFKRAHRCESQAYKAASQHLTISLLLPKFQTGAFTVHSMYTNTTLIDQITQIQLFKLYLKKKGERQHKRHTYDSLWHRAQRYLSGSQHGKPSEGEFKRTNPFLAALGAVGSAATHVPTGDSLSPPCEKKALSGSQCPHQRALGRGDSVSQEAWAQQNNPTMRKAASPRASSSRAHAFVRSSPPPANSWFLNAQKSPRVSVRADVNATTCNSKYCTN